MKDAPLLLPAAGRRMGVENGWADGRVGCAPRVAQPAPDHAQRIRAVHPQLGQLARAAHHHAEGGRGLVVVGAAAGAATETSSGAAVSLGDLTPSRLPQRRPATKPFRARNRTVATKAIGARNRKAQSP